MGFKMSIKNDDWVNFDDTATWNNISRFIIIDLNKFYNIVSLTLTFCYWYVCGPCSMTGEMPDTVQIRDNELKVLKVDDAVNTTFVCEVTNRIGIGKDQVTAFVRGEW